MAFFAGNRRGTGLGHSLLPSVSPRPRTTRKSTTTSSSSSSPSPFFHSSRRRTTFLSLLSPNTFLFTLALSISFLFFLFVFVRHGFPSLSSPSTSSSSSSSSLVNSRHSSFLPRPPRPRRISAGGAAVVDITTKDLYDRIQFLDVDGGAWKQGWEVKYAGDEWDTEKLKVFVVPHSHNDPGWKLTVEEYYDRQSRHILDSIVETLSKDRRRKFIWEEMSYLQRWWRDASKSRRESFTKLVKDGQLEIVGGGWVMNDEANSHYLAIIEQMMEGNMWLNDTIGVLPKNAWAIDPFGYSATMAYLLRRMGFRNMLIQRTHYELKKDLALKKNLEYVWRQSWDVEETTDIFVHMMPFYSYDIPHTCGPEPAICCQFDFARMWGFNYESCPWRENPVETSQENVQDRALLLLDQYKKKSTLYRTNTLLVPLGDDFRYVSVKEVEVQFRNYEKIFDYINSNPSLNAEVKFGTLDDYFQTLRDEAERINYTRRGEVGSGEIGGFPSLSGDFFTYADRQQDYWSGYYVSRPFFKAVDRVLEETLRASEMLVALVLGYCQKLPCAKLSFNFSRKLIAARRNLALFQHHDGVTGTAKNHVMEDYGMRMHTSLHDLQIFMSKAVELLLDGLHEKTDSVVQSVLEPEQVRSRYDVQPVHRSLNVHDGHAYSVVFFNPLEQKRDEIVMVVIDRPDVCVLHSNWSCIGSQISPEWQHGSATLSSGRHRLYWKASVPAMGLQTYYVANGVAECERAKPAELKLFSDSVETLPCPTPYICSKQVGDTAEIKNHHQILTFDVKHGFLKMTRHKDGAEIVIGEEIGMYSSSGGAYLFKPLGEARPVVERGGRLVISKGPLVQEFYSYPKTEWRTPPVSHSTRIYSGEGTLQGFLIEKEYHIELLGHEFNDRELIARYKTSIENKRVFYSDLNGFQMSRRETYDKIPLQGNYYPMPSLAFLQDQKGCRFSVHSRQSLGSASLKSGWLEIMLDRRLVNDDGRGLGQGVMDNRPVNVLFHILTEFNTSVPAYKSAELPLQPSVLSHLVGSHLNYPLHAFVSKEQQDTSLPSPSRTFSPLASTLPCDLHIVGFKVPRPLKFTHMSPGDLRFALIFQRRGWDSSYYRKGHLQCLTLGDEPVNLFFMFKDLAVSNARATSLNLMHDDTEMLGYIEQVGDVAQEGHLLIAPMEIQAYKLDLHTRTKTI